jgi:hypothetical protein
MFRSGIAEALIDSTDWSEFQLMTGSAEDFGAVLRRFVNLGPGSVDEYRALWRQIENHVFAQNEIFSE